MDSNRYEILSTLQVVNLMEEELNKVKDIVDVSINRMPSSVSSLFTIFDQLPKNKLRVLLTKHKWDTGVFLEKFYDGRIELNVQNPKEEPKQQIIEDIPKENIYQIVTRGKRKKEALQDSNTGPARKVSRKTFQKPQKMCEICLDNCNLSVNNYWNLQA